MSPVEAPPPLARVSRILSAHKRKMILFFLLVMGLTVAGTELLPRTYRSQAKLFVRLGRENATLDPTATLGQSSVVAVPTTREAELNSVLEMLLSRDLLEQVVDAVGPGAILGREPAIPADTPPREPVPRETGITDRYRAVTSLARAIKVEAVKKSNVVVITYDGSSPEVCETVVTRLVEFHLDRHIRLNRAPGAYKFLEEQATRLSGQLREAEEELRKLKNDTGLVSPEAQRQAMVARISRFEDDLLQGTAAVAASEAEIRTLRDRLASLPETHVTGKTRGLPNQAADVMRGQLYTLQLRELELLARHPEEHPEVKLTRRQTAAAKALLAREEQEREQVTTGPNKLHEDAELSLLRQEAILASARARAEAVRKLLESERAAAKTLTANELRISRLQRRVEIETAHHRRYVEAFEQGQIDRAIQAERISNINVVQPATYDPKPVSPKRAVNLGLGALLALTGALGLAALSEYLGRPGTPAGEYGGPRGTMA